MNGERWSCRKQQDVTAKKNTKKCSYMHQASFSCLSWIGEGIKNRYFQQEDKPRKKNNFPCWLFIYEGKNYLIRDLIQKRNSTFFIANKVNSIFSHAHSFRNRMRQKKILWEWMNKKKSDGSEVFITFHSIMSGMQCNMNAWIILFFSELWKKIPLRRCVVWSTFLRFFFIHYFLPFSIGIFFYSCFFFFDSSHVEKYHLVFFWCVSIVLWFFFCLKSESEKWCDEE